VAVDGVLGSARRSGQLTRCGVTPHRSSSCNSSRTEV
jgi:hypothetical protein